MDLRSKGITWVGSIYHKFESMCQEVDGLMSQEKVKYVKHQVQVSCENVQKLYVEAVHDLIHFPSGDSNKDYPYISEMSEGEKTEVNCKESLIDERSFLLSQSEGTAHVGKDLSAILLANSCSANENSLPCCQLEGSIFLDEDLSANEDSCSANENLSLHSQLEASISSVKDSNVIPLLDSCPANEDILLHSQLEASTSLDKDSRTMPLVDSCSANDNLLLHSQLEASSSLVKDSSAIPLLDSCSANEDMLLDSQVEPSTFLDKDSSTIPLVDSCSADENVLPYSQLEASISSDKEASAISLLDSCPANENMLLDSQLEASASLEKDSSAIPLVDSCSANDNLLLHHQLEAIISLDKESSAVPILDLCPVNESMLLHSQLEASTSLHKDSNTVPLVDSSSANANASLHPQLETRISKDKDSSVNACSANECMLLHSEFEDHVSLNRGSSVTSPCGVCFTDVELYLRLHSNSSVSVDEVSTAASLLHGMPDENQLEAYDTVMKSDIISAEATEQHHPLSIGENDGNSEVTSCTSESLNILPAELVIPALPPKKGVEHGSVLLVLGLSNNVTDSIEGENHVEKHDVATEKSTQISNEFAEHEGEAGGNNNVPDEVPSMGCPPTILQSKLVPQVVSHRKTVYDRSIPSIYVPSLSIDIAGSSASTLNCGFQCTNHIEACIKPAEESIPLSEAIGHKFLGAEEKNSVSDVDVEATCRAPNEMSQVESPCKKCEKDSNFELIGASVLPTEIAVSRSLKNFDSEESSKMAYAVGTNSVTEEEFEDVRLDDDYADSEEEKDEMYLISLLASKKRTYKKKLQEALLSRIRTTKRDDCEEIIAWYRDFNKNTKQRRNLKKMQTHDGAESDWELV